jgi:predicted RNA-binding Zn ribbon-like protein
MLWPLAQSAGALLTGDQRARVRECSGHDCRWLFLDLSRNHSRRWCDMNDCGNRAKARRHYQRRRTATPAEA